ncbi:MAG: Bifunctional protein Aas [Chlamydiia bacterium]|nr:Bifunctional protein Aas [Chlamydiia bacterium]MCH9615201.1 Bifunctional protein Aas [Chlamydiia bacterium]MCH9628477.1 Bifunctional protein Aas [Chlamydiia bacterium]
MKIFHKFLFLLLKIILKFRYRITITGDDLSKIENKRVLILPNHPAEIDPIILMSVFEGRFKPRPLVVEYFFHMTGAGFFMRAIKAISVPNFDTSSNKWKMKLVDQVYENVEKGLEMGDNFLIYPSGHLQKQEREIVGGSSFVHGIVQRYPDVKIISVRISGLWGSLFSRALTGQVPPFWKILVKGVKIILKNGIFFVPKRPVNIEIKDMTDLIPKEASRLDFNQYLDAFYNEKSDPLTLVSHSAFREDLPEVIHKQKTRKKRRNLEISDEMRQAIFNEVRQLAETDNVGEEMDLSIDLGLDSLDIATLHAFLDQRYDIGDITPGELGTVYDLLEAASGHADREGDTAVKLDKSWPEEANRSDVRPPTGSTIQEAFLHICERMGSATAIADQNSGMLTYKRLKLGALLLAKKIREMPGDYVGILLPSSVGAYLTLIAVLMAKKLPVMLNWTAGVRTLNYSQKLLGLRTVITSRKFLDRVEDLDLGVLEEKLVFLEDVKASITFGDKLRALFGKPPTFEDVNEHDPALLLFTSGTETYPKAVPLSHYNLLENQRAALRSIEINRHDIMFGVLPPFHSFGCSVTGLMPILAGMRAYFAPDPTDNQGMVRDIEHWKPTIICLAPSFFRNLFRVAEAGQLNSVRLFVTGAEKAPQELFNFVSNLGKQVIEGYGITECSPMVSLNKNRTIEKGVGKPLPGIDLCTIDPETQQTVPGEGEICIKGPSVFSGYMSPTAKNPFVEIKGERWYRSGDIGSIDKEGNLILGGRIKRFVKIGGEMISLTALEDELSDAARRDNWHPDIESKASMAVAVQEAGDKPRIVLFSTFPISREKVNTALRTSGFGRIVKISEVREVGEIPITGTGKVHFRKLDEMLC